MGFMDKLKEIGLGNTGPRGNMNSGATNYSNYAKDRAALESERQAAQTKAGIAQALALESKNGKMISWNKFTDIAKKWNVPVQEVSTPGKDINDGLKTQMIKNQTHEAMQKYASKKKEDPSWAPTEEDIKNEAITQQWLPETMGILKDYAVQQKQRPKGYNLPSGAKRFIPSLSGKDIEVASNIPDPSTGPDGKPKDAQTWVLPNLDTVRSFDGGRTYIGKDGKQKPMPTEGAYKINAQFSGTDIAALKSRQGAGAEAKTVKTETKQGSAKAAAIAGTGVYANLGAAIDATLGGLGVDALFGKEGFFKDTQDARQKLRLIKQLGKSAFMNSSRGAIWEQQKIDKLFPNPTDLFANPRTEARKFITLRQSLLTEKRFNLEAIAGSGDPKEISKFKASNADIDKLLAHIGTGESGSGLKPLSPQAQEWLKKKGN